MSVIGNNANRTSSATIGIFSRNSCQEAGCFQFIDRGVGRCNRDGREEIHQEDKNDRADQGCFDQPSLRWRWRRCCPLRSSGLGAIDMMNGTVGP